MVRETDAPQDWRDLAEAMARWRSLHAIELQQLCDRVRRELDEDVREATRQAVEEAFA